MRAAGRPLEAFRASEGGCFGGSNLQAALSDSELAAGWCLVSGAGLLAVPAWRSIVSNDTTTDTTRDTTWPKRLMCWKRRAGLERLVTSDGG